MLLPLVAALSLLQEPAESPTIAKLAVDVTKGDDKAVEAFWTQTAKGGTPLFEPDGSNINNTLVTFVWKGDSATRNVIVMLDGARSIRNLQLVRLGETNVWHRTYRFPADSAFYYRFSVNDTLVPFDEETNWALREKSFTSDPLNPKGIVIGGTRSFSLAVLPGAVEDSLYQKRDDVVAGKFEPGGRQAFVFKSRSLGDHRTWVYTTPGLTAGPATLVVFLDGSGSWQLIPSVTMLDNLYHQGRIGATVAVYTDSPDRDRDLACSDAYLDFLITELIPWVKERYKVEFSPKRAIICGASLGGLCAGYAALKRPDVFGGALMQSPSLWWSPPGDPENEWLARHAASLPMSGSRYYVAPGAFEVTANRKDSISILFSSRHFRDVLTAKGYEVKYAETNGGHDSLNWKASLPPGILWLIGRG